MEPATDLLSLVTRSDGRDAIVVVRGELDLGTAPLVERELTELIDGRSCRSIVLDLHDLTFMGSTGLCLLLNVQARLQSRGGEIVLARPSSAVTRTLEIVGLLSTFTIQGDVPSERAACP
jgi:anti-anti-sigma factor